MRQPFLKDTVKIRSDQIALKGVSMRCSSSRSEQLWSLLLDIPDFTNSERFDLLGDGVHDVALLDYQW